jgi:hypothetical protein
MELLTMTGNRVSYEFDLKGPRWDY